MKTIGQKIAENRLLSIDEANQVLKDLTQVEQINWFPGKVPKWVDYIAKGDMNVGLHDHWRLLGWRAVAKAYYSTTTRTAWTKYNIKTYKEALIAECSLLIDRLERVCRQAREHDSNDELETDEIEEIQKDALAINETYIGLMNEIKLINHK